MRSSRARRRSSASSGARRRRSCVVAEPLGLPLDDARAPALEPAVRALEPRVQLGEVRDDEPAGDRRRRGADVGGEVDERRVLLVPDGRDDRHRAGGDGAHEPLVRERQQVLEADPPPRASTITSTPRSQRSAIAAAISAAARAPWTYVSATSDVRRREAGRDRRQHVALRGGVVAGHEPDEARDPRQRPLPLGREQPLGGELLLQPLERREVRAEPEALDRERAQVEVAALLVQLRPPVDVHALAVAQVEPQPVELPARHLHREARAVLGILQREEDRRPALLPPQLGDLALDPERRQPLQPARDALVEGAHGVDLAPLDLRRLDLHRAAIRPG